MKDAKTISRVSGYRRWAVFGKGKTAETFESVLDLFSLLAFALISVSILFGTYHSKASPDSNSAEFTFEKVGSGDINIADLPDDTVMIIISCDDKGDKVIIQKSGQNPTSVFAVNSDTRGAITNEFIKEKFDGYLLMFRGAGYLRMVFMAKEDHANYSLFVHVQRWFMDNMLAAIVHIRLSK